MSAVMDRFWAKVDTTGGCWIWTAYTVRGYGRFNFNGRVRFAHRVAYEALREPIPAGLFIDHLCRNRACVNPWHLEPVTSAENRRRGLQGNVTVCAKGHDYTPENTYTSPSGRRGCRICRRDRSNARNADPERVARQRVYSARHYARRLAERVTP